ncbi:MAG: ABC transporter ATP-binding protein [Bacteroidales bacterium]|nr:ABC transporter ATP-binding protein [Bacteroidales bacterium]
MRFLEINQLKKAYSKGNIEINALLDINFSVDQGDFVSIVGKSGSGKSTLLNIIGGLDKPDEGYILFNGSDLSKLKRNEQALYRRFDVGMIFQSFNLVNHLSALENVMLALTFGGVPKKSRKSIAAQLLTHVGLEHRLTHKPKELSGGEMQRVAIARAIANNPKMLLADEPTGNLDSSTSQEIIQLLQNLNKEKGVTIIMVTHDLETAQHISNKVIKLKDGQIIDGLL